MKRVAAILGLVMLWGVLSAHAQSVVWQVQRPNGFEADAFGDLGKIAIDDNGTIYVADSYNGVYRLDSDGNIQDLLTSPALTGVDGIALSPDGSLWLASGYDNKIVHLSSSGDVLAEVGGLGTGAGQFGEFSPTDIVVDGAGNVYVFDTQEDANGDSFGRIQVFDGDGNFQDEFLTDPSGNGNRIYGVLALGADNNLYIGDFWGGIAVLDRQGNVLTENLLDGSQEFAVATALTVASDGTLYFAEDGTIYQVNENGQITDQFGVLQVDDSQPQTPGEFSEIGGLGVLPNGDVIAADTNFSFSQIVRVSFD